MTHVVDVLEACINQLADLLDSGCGLRAYYIIHKIEKR
jgi:hypothetical protein